MRKLSTICLLGLMTAATAVPALAEEMASAAAAGFYAVDAAGRSVPEDPVASGFARAPVRSAAGKPASPPVAVHDPQPAAPPRLSIKIRNAASRPEPDPAAAWRCEAAGFYYAADGRCVAPAYQPPPAAPPGRPRWR